MQDYSSCIEAICIVYFVNDYCRDRKTIYFSFCILVISEISMTLFTGGVTMILRNDYDKLTNVFEEIYYLVGEDWRNHSNKREEVDNKYYLLLDTYIFQNGLDVDNLLNDPNQLKRCNNFLCEVVDFKGITVVEPETEPF